MSRNHALNGKYASFSNLLTWTHIKCGPPTLPSSSPTNTHAYLHDKTNPEEKVLGLVLIDSNWVTCHPWTEGAALGLARPGSYILGVEEKSTYLIHISWVQVDLPAKYGCCFRKKRMNKNIKSLLQAFLFLEIDKRVHGINWSRLQLFVEKCHAYSNHPIQTDCNF